MSVIRRLRGLEILDSRGRPTVRASCELESGARGTAAAPSGASTGGSEARELRDGDPSRYAGLGCRQAVRHIDETIQQALAGRELLRQEDLDRALIDLDGTPDRARLGANALLAVSLAFCRAQAAEQGSALFQHLARLTGEGSAPRMLPRPIINLFSGGKHAGGQVPIQDLLIVPVAARSIDSALATAFDVYRAAASLIHDRYGMRLLRADEGGLAPPFENVEAMFDLALEATAAAGYSPGVDVVLGVDVASSHFYHAGRYDLMEEPLSGAEMIERLLAWADRYPIASIEDGLAEEDWEHWSMLAGRAAGRFLVVGDDLTCTNPDRIRRAVELGAADTLLLKVNQVGTLTEADEARRLAREAGWRVMVSARSGETEDDWLADLAVGWGGDQIKIGSITQSERLAKYNRLLEIESDLALPLAPWPGR